MRIGVAVLILALLSVQAWAQSPDQKLTVIGKLVRVMAIGGESTGWAIEVSPTIMVGEKQVSSLQVRYRSVGKLENLADKQVKATGKIMPQHGVETGAQPLLEISTIRELKATAGASAAQPKTQ